MVLYLDPDCQMSQSSPALDRNPSASVLCPLNNRTATSELKHLQLLLTTFELEERTPTQLVWRMQQLMGDNAGSNPDYSLLWEPFSSTSPATSEWCWPTQPTVTSITSTPTPSALTSPPTAKLEVAQLRSEICDMSCNPRE